MKVVINRTFGGFSVSKEIARELNLTDRWDVDRTDERLIEAVIKDPKRASGEFAKLKVAEIPDEATDWDLKEYNGVETVLYVIDGKIHYL